MATMQETAFQALGNVLEQHYGRYEANTNSNVDAVNYAILWNTLLDALQQNTLDTFDIDQEYIRIVQERDRERAERNL